MDETKALMNVIDILVKHIDNMSAIEAVLKNSQWGVYATLASALVVFFIGILNFRASMRMTKSQNEKAYREIITTERVKKYNAFRSACVDVIDVFLNGTKVIGDLKDHDTRLVEYNKIIRQLNRFLIILDLEMENDEKKCIEKDLDELKDIFSGFKEESLYNNMLPKTRAITKKIKTLLDNRWEKIEKEAKI
jgi:hypothetical protein